MGMFIGDQAITMAYLGDLPISTTDKLAYVSDGLLNYWDAQYANTISSSGPYTLWEDLIENRQAQTAFGTYISSSLPYHFYLDGLQGYIDLYPSASRFEGQNPITMLMWVSMSVFDDNNLMAVGGNDYSVVPNVTGSIGITSVISGSNTYLAVESARNQWYTSSLETTTGSYYQVAFTWPNSGDYTLQGINLYLNNQKDTPNSGSIDISIVGDYYSNVILGQLDNVGDPNKLTGNITLAMIYNRILSDAEIQQNFDYFKPRFGY